MVRLYHEVIRLRAHLGVSYKTAWRMWKRNAIPHRTEQLDTGTIIIHLDEPELGSGVKAAIYARVSSAENKNNLDAQAERLTHDAMAKGYQVVRVVKEVGSGLNDHRKKLERLLEQDDYTLLFNFAAHTERIA